MANTLRKASYFIDTTGSITVGAQKPVIMGMMISPSAGDSRVVIKEATSGVVVIDVRIVPTESRYLDFSGFDGIEVTSTFEIATLTNISSVILYGNWYMPTGTGK